MTYPNGIPVKWAKCGMKYEGYYVGRLHYHDEQMLTHEHACETTEGRVHIVRDDEFIAPVTEGVNRALYEAICAAVKEVMDL